jgi:SpoVK/Ycf46/Vps4 family AAA+-type ATPase
LEQRRKAFGSVKARDFGLPAPKGVLVVGVPGGGKSLTAKQTAQTWQLPLLRLDPGRLFGSLVGQSESQARQAIEAAEACAPCILWVDEIEKGLAGGSGGSSTDGGTTQRVFGTILTWLQEKDSDVFVVATANRVDALPPELLRKGRFDDIFTVGLPNATERETIAKIHLERRKRDLGAKAAPAIAKATEGYVGAEIEQAVIDGLFAAYAEGRDLETTDVLAAVKATTPLSKTAPEDIKRIEAWAQGRARPASAPETTKTTTKKKRRRGPALGSK